jgi:ubiquinone/menaquinone biosynthesis C-methylase UbiE
VDADATVLALAREAAAAQGVTNIEFRVGNVYDISDSEEYDVVYCRFLLHHLRRPRELVRVMWGAVRPGGSILIEDADFDGMFSEPPSEAADYFARVYPRLIKRVGGDPVSGRRLYGYFLDAGIQEPRLSLVQPVFANGEEKSIHLLSVEAIAHELVAEGLASEAEVRSTIAALAAYTEDPRTVLGSPRVFQVWARK